MATQWRVASTRVNGVSTERGDFPAVTGVVQLGEGNLFIGAGDEDHKRGNSFEGAIDELAIFTHARSARSICASAHGADCEKISIQSPQHSRFAMSTGAPACTGPLQLDTIECQSAMHRGCALRGVQDALLSTVNLGLRAT